MCELAGAATSFLSRGQTRIIATNADSRSKHARDLAVGPLHGATPFASNDHKRDMRRTTIVDMQGDLASV
jgi:hypothetical protein